MKQLNSHQFEGVYKSLDINLDKLGCVMLDLQPLDNMYSIAWDGAETALYYSKNPNRKWIDGWVADKVAHITLLYGLLDNAHNWENLIETVLWDWKIEEVEIDHIGYFDSPYEDENYYCIVAHIKATPELLEGHQRLELLPHINTFTGYKPHMTICYLDKKQDIEAGIKYRDTMIECFNKYWAGKKLKVKDGINLGYKPEVLPMSLPTEPTTKQEESEKSWYEIIYDNDNPEGPAHGWIQWKGTDVCIDLYCICGTSGHFDGDFMYSVKCAACGRKYAVGGNIKLIPLDTQELIDANEKYHGDYIEFGEHKKL